MVAGRHVRVDGLVRGHGYSSRSQSVQPTSVQRPSAQSKARSKTPPPSGSPSVMGRPRPASTRHSSRSVSRSPDRCADPGRRVVGLGGGLLGADHRPSTGGLPPRAGLDPVRQHRPDLPQPTAPQELLGALGGTLRRRVLIDWDPGGPRRGRRNASCGAPPRHVRTGVRTTPRYTAPRTAGQPPNPERVGVGWTKVRRRRRPARPAPPTCPAGRHWCPCARGSTPRPPRSGTTPPTAP